MRILYHHRTRGKDVEGVHIREIVNALRKLGNEVYIVSPPGCNPLNTMEIGLHKDSTGNIISRSLWKMWDWISRHFPQIGFEILELCYNFVGYYRIKRVVRRYNIDAIYERYAFFTWVGTYIAKKKKIPIILEVNEISGFKRVRGQILVGLANRIERKIFRMASAIVVVSDFLKRHIEKMGVSADKIYVIPNAVDLKKFNLDIPKNEIRRKLGIEDKIVIGFVGKFVAWSNLEFLLQVFHEVSKEKQNVHLMLVGDGQIRDELEKIVQGLQLRNKVTFTGTINHADVPIFIAAMDICVIPQSNQYRSPVKLFEYMAMSKPVIAPHLEPIERVIAHNSNGILFNPGDENSLREALIDLIENDDERNKIGDMARRTIIKNHTWLKNAEKTLQIYESL